MKDKTRILWLSRHPPLNSQIKELKRIFGDIDLTIDPKPFSDARDIAKRAKDYDEIVVVAPLSVIRQLITLSIKPLWAEMERVDSNGEVYVNGRHYNFIRFRRIVDIKIVYEDL